MGYIIRQPKQNKYGALRSGPYGSKLEQAVYQVLKLREKSGELTDIKQQVAVNLICGITWKVDFSFGCLLTDRRTYVEAKGMETDRYRICKKLWTKFGPGPLEIWKGIYQSPYLDEIINQDKKEDNYD